MTGDVPPSTVSPAAFGRFRVLHQIGAGSLGPVFRAEDPASQTSVVIKVLRLHLTPERARIVADELAMLQDRVPAHPGIAPLVKAGIRDVEPFVVSAFTAGESLDAVLRQSGPTPMAEALPRLVQVAAGLDFCADASLWHGGLHPRDLLISPSETAVIGVGIAPILERVGIKLPVRRPYTAPEVVDGGATSPAADQFALAAIAFEWLYGRRIAGPAETRLEVPELPGTDRVAMADAFSSALSAHPDGRFESLSAFVAALADAMEKADIAARPVLVGPRPRRPRPVSLTSIVPSLPGDPISAPASREGLADGVEAEVDDEAALQTAIDGLRTADDLRKADTVMHAPPPAMADVAVVPGPTRARVRWATILTAIIGAIVIGGGAGYWYAMNPMVNVVDNAPARPAVPSGNTASTPLLTTGSAANADLASTGRPAVGDATPAPVPPALSAETAPSGDGAGTTSRDESGRVLVRSTPAGADVVINGERRGLTPLALRDLPFGAYLVSVSRAGYSSEQHQVLLTSARPSQSLEIGLVGGPGVSGGTVTSSTIATPGATIGSLMIESRPVAATVFIDGRVAGITPLMLERLSPGAHAVRLERTGYHPWTTTVNVVAGELTRLAASLAGGHEQE